MLYEVITISEAALRQLLEATSSYRRGLERLELRRLDERIVDASVWTGLPREAEMRDEQQLRNVVQPALEAQFP